MDNFFLPRFGKKSTHREKRMEKVYFQRKINPEELPNFKKMLKTFFTDYSKYFQTSFENNRIIVGKKYDNNQKNNMRISLTESGNQKLKTKKYIKRPTMKRNGVSRADSLNRSRYMYEDKRKSFEDSILKPGQKFIDDKEIEKLFNLYKEVRRVNKNKSSNFVNIKELKEYKELKNDFNLNFNSKSNDNFFKLNSCAPTLNSNENNAKEKKFGMNAMRNNFETLNDSEYNRTLSTNIGCTLQDDSTKNNNIFKSVESDKEEKDGHICKTDVVKRRKLINMQNQYIYNNIQEVIKKQFAESLSLQENALLFHNKNRKYQYNFRKYLNNHIKKKFKSDLLIQEDKFRKKLELKAKIDFFQKKLNPDKIYDWYKDLHSSKNFLPILDKKFETIRNPKTMKKTFISSNHRSRTLDKDQYLKNSITSKYFNNLEKEADNVNNNFGSLFVEGKNLLQFENNLAKKLKGRKIINDYERLMSPTDLKNEDIYANIGKK